MPIQAKRQRLTWADRIVPERVKINGTDEAHLAASFAADDGASWRFFVGTTAARSKLGNLLRAAR
jgi:hypothetical protein